MSYLHLTTIRIYLCHLQIGITVEKFNLIGGRDFHAALAEALAVPFVGIVSRLHPLTEQFCCVLPLGVRINLLQNVAVIANY